MRTCTLYTIDVLYIILYLSLSVFVYYTYSMWSYRHTCVNVRVCVRECVCVRDGVLVSRISIHLNSKNMHHLVQPPVSHLLSSLLYSTFATWDAGVDQIPCHRAASAKM